MARQLTKRNGNGLRPTFPFPNPFGRDIDELFGGLLSRDFGWGSEDTIAVPTMDVSETDEAYQATLELPGVKTEDIDIQVNGNVLTVSGETRNEAEEDGRTFRRVERTYGSFARTITLPCEVNEDNVTAKLESGLLTINLPKAEDSKPSKIAVESA